MITTIVIVVLLYGFAWYRFATRKVRYAVVRTATLSKIPQQVIVTWIMDHKSQMDLLEYEEFIEDLSEKEAKDLKELFLDLSHFLEVNYPKHARECSIALKEAGVF
ncbi:hypothetical protein MHO82_05605 [Vibrio sp. Of7-15]|uniref:hypothetical protein n=1 Tax=Vibrio sp. Of7-15 TaxID=2724879 RepID=UPI001EF1961F|nr:hypothetical protein [Vibrio sp. Of7-15]MCG7496329.1 hypothetical protein [Vibrio sp. Of7-15]